MTTVPSLTNLIVSSRFTSEGKNGAGGSPDGITPLCTYRSMSETDGAMFSKTARREEKSS